MIKKRKHMIDALLAIIMTFNMLVASTGTVLAKKDQPPRMDPDFLQLVQAYPEAVFKVIVQKDAKNKDLKDMELEKDVRKGGGQVRKQLDLIVSFSAEMTGKEIEKLARNPKVRWISPDAPLVSTGSFGLSTVLDSFKGVFYRGNDGSEWWSGSWIEGNLSGDTAVSAPNTGTFRVVKKYYCAGGSGFCLLVAPNIAGEYVYHEANLNNIAGTLSVGTLSVGIAWAGIRSAGIPLVGIHPHGMSNKRGNN